MTPLERVMKSLELGQRGKLIRELAELASMANRCGNAEQARAYHDGLKADESAWQALELRGVQKIDDTEALELRNCAKCASTLARKIT